MAGKATSGGKQFFMTDMGSLSAHSIALRITSAEMRAKPAMAGEREILPGDTIIDTERPHVRAGDTVALLVGSDPDIHLRKAVMRPGGKMVYVALNSDYGEYDRGDNVGRVMWVLAAM